jgi:hypothetical protein
MGRVIDAPDLISEIQFGIKATNSDDVYSCGMRNGMRWCQSLIDGKEPLYEKWYSKKTDSGDRSGYEGWTLVGYELPKPKIRVLVRDIDGDITIARCLQRWHSKDYVYTNADWFTDYNTWVDVVAWMPLPREKENT